MTDQISTLGLAVDSTQVKNASQVLREFAASGDHAETSATALERATASMVGELRRIGGGVQELIRLTAAQRGAASASQSLAVESAKAAKSHNNAAEAYRKEAEAVKQFVPAAIAAATAVKSMPLPLESLSSAGLKQFNAELGQTTTQAMRAANAVGLVQAKSASVTLVRAPNGTAPVVGTPSNVGFSRLTMNAASAKSAIDGVTFAVKAQTAALAATSAAMKATANEAQRLHSITSGITGAGSIARSFQPTNRANFNVGDGASLAATASTLRQVADQTERIRTASAKPVPLVPPNAVNQMLALGAATKGLGQHQDAQGKSAKRAAYENQQLAFQLNDFFVQVASGGSPLTALIQQGSQLSGTFGGTGKALKAVLSIITPARIAFTGLASAISGVGYGLYTSAEGIKQFKNTLITTGNFAGQTEGGFNQLAERVAANAKSGIGQARELSLALLSTGEISEASLERASTASVLYQKALSKTTEEIAKDFSSMARSPAEFAQSANRSLHFLTAAQIEAIKSFEENGQKVQALDVIYGALIERMSGVQANMGSLDKKVDGLSIRWQRLKDDVRAYYDEFNRGEPTVEQRIQRLQNRLDLTPEDSKLLPNVTPRSAVQKVLDEAYAEKNEEDRRAQFEAEKVRRQAAGVEANNRINGLLRRSRSPEQALKEALAKLDDDFHAQELAGTPVSNASKVLAREQVKRDATRQASGGSNEAGQVLRAALGRDLRGFREAFEAEREELAFQNRFLQGEYQAGLTSLEDFYANKRETIEKTTAAEIGALEKERQRLKNFKDQTKDPSERVQVQARIDENEVEQGRAKRNSDRELILTTQERTASLRALTEQVDSFNASLLQLEGNDEAAGALRAASAIQRARELANQSRGPDGRITIDVAAYARAVQLTEQFNAVQRRTQVLSSASATAEDALMVAAESRGASLRETERGIFEIRKQELDQLELLVLKVRELADESTNPVIRQFATDLTLRYAKAAAAVDPALNRLRQTTKQLAADLASTVANLPQTFADAYSRRRSDAFDDINNQKSEYDRRIDILEGYLAESQDKQDKARLRAKIKDLEDQKRNAKGPSRGSSLFGALKDSLLKPAGNTVMTAVQKVLIEEPLKDFLQTQLSSMTDGDSGLGKALRDAIGVKVDPKEVALATQTAAITSSTTALQLLEMAARNAAQGLSAPRTGGGSGNKAPTIGPDAELGDATDAFGSSMEESADVTLDFSRIVPTASDVVSKLAQSASGANQSLALLPSIISVIQSASVANSASSSGGGLFGAIAGMFGGGGGGGAMSNELFHSGGIVGQATQMRLTASDTVRRYYHSGGIAGKPADLKPNEVAAVLMGGPKGTREEVLHASDPRHRDNLDSGVLGIIMQACRELEARKSVSTLLQRLGVGAPDSKGVQGARELGGPVSSGSMYRVNERGPELLQVAGKQYLMMGNQAGSVKSAGESAGKPVVNVTVNFDTGGQPVDRRTADQLAVAASSGVRRALARNS